MDKLRGQYNALMKCSKRQTKESWENTIKVMDQCQISGTDNKYKHLQPSHAVEVQRLTPSHRWQYWVDRCEKYKWSVKVLKEKIAVANLDGAVGKARQRDFKKWVTLYQEQMENLLPQLSDLDAIITDPPYGRDYIGLYETLAELSSESLSKTGVLAVMCGQSYLPETLAMITKHIQYRWIMAYLTPGGQSPQIWDRKINTFWKPILLFGAREEWIGDVVKSDINDNDKRFHAWGQSESGMARLVEALTKPGDLICDPFLGAGTTGVVAISLGRQFVGADIDKDKVDIARKRIGAAYASK